MNTFKFEIVANAAVAIQNKGTSLWANMAGFIGTYVAGQEVTPEVDDVKAMLLDEELLFGKSNPKAPALKNIGAYRSAKSVALKALEVGVCLLYEKGKPKGKTQVENEIKELANESVKTPLDKFRSTMNTATAIGDKLLTEMELLSALQLVKELNDKLVADYALVKKQVA